MAKEISWENLGKAKEIYKAFNYHYIETQWLVSERAIRATLPSDARMFSTFAGSFVGSGEQGFIQKMLDGTLEHGMHQTITPCFRDESEYSDLKRLSFMKLELIDYMPVNASASLVQMINEALQCFQTLANDKDFNLLETEDGIDIMRNNIELGSYGIRVLGNHQWVFGTGLAEPRFSEATVKSKIHIVVPKMERTVRLYT